MPDDAAFHRNRPSTRISTGWWCAECKEASDLCDLNEDMHCEVCAGPWEDPESVMEMSISEMRAEFGTWSV